MTTEQYETGEATGEPIELYRFAYGLGRGTVFCYYDADIGRDITFNGEVYTPEVALDRDPLSASGSLDKSEIIVSLPESNAVAELFRVYPPGDVVGLTIFRCHYDEETGGITVPQAIWVGRVLSCGREGFEAKLSCEPTMTSLRRVGLRRHYQYMCPHDLYGPACGVSAPDHRTKAQVVRADLRSVTVRGQVSDQHAGGILAWTPLGDATEQRTILYVARDELADETVLTLAGSVRKLQAGAEVEVYKGCNHRLENCRDVFDNAPNFGGTPYIPLRNPHGTTSIYH